MQKIVLILSLIGSISSFASDCKRDCRQDARECKSDWRATAKHDIQVRQSLANFIWQCNNEKRKCLQVCEDLDSLI
jgi:hypothetical protein